MRKSRASAEEYIQGILAGNRILLSKAITLVESSLPEDAALARQILDAVMPHTGRAFRIGITGVPGVGKSTFIEAFGSFLVERPHSVAVLAIDPSSSKSRGSILGDKTRMERLSMHPKAYIRPSPTGTSLGGVARKTREAMLLCEAAGFEVIIVETVGVGQSETLVRGMVDFFLLLMLAGAGDELQGIKKGIMEMADAIAINKAEGENLQQARLAQQEYQNALHLMRPEAHGWQPQVLTCSALQEQGIAEIWALMQAYQKRMQASGYWQQNRQEQQLAWMRSLIQQQLEQHFYEHSGVKAQRAVLEQQLQAGQISAISAAGQLLALYFREFTAPSS
jgi:LAO/AO transport system kinase